VLESGNANQEDDHKGNDSVSSRIASDSDADVWGLDGSVSQSEGNASESNDNPSEPDSCYQDPFQGGKFAKVQSASNKAYMLLRTAPHLVVFKPCLRKLLKDAKAILRTSLGRHGEKRTPSAELRGAIARLQANSQHLPAEGRAFITQVTDGVLDHLGAVNTDKSFKPFAIVLHGILELATMASP